MKTFNVEGVTFSKRFYLDSVVLDLKCPLCGNINEYDFGEHHLDYFCSGDTETIRYLYCDHCGEDTDYSGTDKYFAKVKVDLQVTLEEVTYDNDES